MAAMKRTVLTLMLFASLAAAQIMPPVVTPPVTTTTSPPTIKPPKSPKAPKSPPATPPSGSSGSSTDYSVEPTASEGPIPPDYLNTPTDGGSSGSGGNGTSYDGINTMDPTISGCRNQYHVTVADGTACNTRCTDKLARSKNEATIDPEVYPSSLGTGTCCNCNFERTPGAGTLSPDASSSGGGNSTGSSGALDPATFKPPTTEELIVAVNPTATVVPEPNEVNTYAVLRVTGGPFTTPLSFDYILGFVYAFNNVTGIPWQYKGDAPSIPNEYPAAPNGLPQVRNGPPPAPPMAVPTVALAPPVSAPVGTPPAPLAAAPTIDPTAASTVVPPPVDPAAAVPTAAPVTPAPLRRRLRSSSLSSSSQKNRRLLQDTGTGQYSFSPMPGASGDYTSGDTSGDYSGNNGNSDYGSGNSSGDYGNTDYTESYSPSPSGSSPSPPANDYGNSDYSSPSPENGGNDYGNGDSPSPSPDPYYESPSPDPYGASPSPSMDSSSPPAEKPSPPPPSPVIVLTAPPAPPGTPLPPNADGIWYFSMMPLSDSKFIAMATALNVATGDGSGAFLTYLTAAGVPATGVELRYIGQASQGQLDLTKKLDGDLFGAASYASAPPPPDSKMSTATIGAIVGGVVGGVVLIAIAGILVASNRRKSSKAEKQALTQRWKTERELVEAERVKLDAGASGAVYANGSYKTRSQNSAHDAGFVAMTTTDLDQQRSMRRAATMAAEAKLSSKQLGIEASPSMSAKSGGGATPKPSRLDSMRAALGLNKTSSAIKKGGNAGGSTVGATAAATAAVGGVTTPSSAAAAAPRSGSFGWTVEGGTGVSPLNPTRSLRSQFSTGAGPVTTAAPPSRFGGDIEAPSSGSGAAGDKPSPWGKMFSSKK